MWYLRAWDWFLFSGASKGTDRLEKQMHTVKVIPISFQEEYVCPFAHARFRLKSSKHYLYVSGDILFHYFLPGNNLFMFIKYIEVDLLKQNGVNPSGKQKHFIILIHHLFFIRNFIVIINSGGKADTPTACQTVSNHLHSCSFDLHSYLFHSLGTIIIWVYRCGNRARDTII